MPYDCNTGQIAPVIGHASDGNIKIHGWDTGPPIFLFRPIEISSRSTSTAPVPIEMMKSARIPYTSFDSHNGFTKTSVTVVDMQQSMPGPQ